MVAGSNSSFAVDVLLSAQTTERLKKFLKEKGIPVSGLKHELFTKASNFIGTAGLVSELDVKAFRELQVKQSVSFKVLRRTGWCKELLKISENSALSWW